MSTYTDGSAEQEKRMWSRRVCRMPASLMRYGEGGEQKSKSLELCINEVRNCKKPHRWSALTFIKLPRHQSHLPWHRYHMTWPPKFSFILVCVIVNIQHLQPTIVKSPAGQGVLCFETVLPQEMTDTVIGGSLYHYLHLSSKIKQPLMLELVKWPDLKKTELSFKVKLQRKKNFSKDRHILCILHYSHYSVNVDL